MFMFVAPEFRKFNIAQLTATASAAEVSVSGTLVEIISGRSSNLKFF